jgi:hypothetical protein
VIVFGRRLFLPFAASTAFFLVSGALASQSLPSAKTPLPDEPLPQTQTQPEIAAARNLLAEAYSSSSVAGASDSSELQTQSPTQPQTSQPQDQAPSPDHPLSDAEKKQAAENELQRELHQRLGGVVPNFNAVLDGNTVPLTAGQKMRAARSTLTSSGSR